MFDHHYHYYPATPPPQPAPASVSWWIRVATIATVVASVVAIVTLVFILMWHSAANPTGLIVPGVHTLVTLRDG